MSDPGVDRPDRSGESADGSPERRPGEVEWDRSELTGGLVWERTDHLPFEERMAVHEENRLRRNPPPDLLTRADDPGEEWLRRREAAEPESSEQGSADVDVRVGADAGGRTGAVDLDDRISDDPDAPTFREVLEKFAGPDGLTEQLKRDDDAYVAAYGDERPWLGVSEDPLVRHVYCERDRQGGHDPARHDVWRDAEAQRERAEELKDPAHPTDSTAYHNSVDALQGQMPSDGIGGKGKQHKCGEYSTWMSDPIVWATATARILEHPRVKEALTSGNPKPDDIKDLPIRDVLGPDGHRYCQGYVLVADGFATVDDAKKNRTEWAREVRETQRAEWVDRDEAQTRVEDESARGEIPWEKPQVERISSFEGGSFQVNFRRDPGGRPMIPTICVNPRD